LVEGHKTNFLKRVMTSLVVVIPIFLILLYQNLVAFFVLITIACFLGIYEWIKNNFRMRLLGFFLILNFGFWSVFFVNGSHGFTDNANFFWYGVIILNTAIFDSVAYFVGSNFGTIFIVKKISPNKTLEGLLGGVLASVLFGILIASIDGQYFMIVGYLILGCISAFFGDLLISFLKRQSGTKDTGNILPGHGGVLDRLDSHLIATPILILVALIQI
tara:strand:- start:343 stop:993 length:651 start_codon:yes stop_codon:yes gene_type:complete